MATEFTGVWAVITTEGKSYIGKVVATQVGSKANGFHKEGEEVDQDAVLDADRVTLNPAYDFFSPLRPVQGPNGQMGFSREPIVTPFEFALENMPVYVRPSVVTFFDDMKDGDRRTYENFVTGAEQQRTAARAQRSGLTLVDSTRKR
jgi:hypothetical protein